MVVFIIYNLVLCKAKKITELYNCLLTTSWNCDRFFGFFRVENLASSTYK